MTLHSETQALLSKGPKGLSSCTEHSRALLEACPSPVNPTPFCSVEPQLHSPAPPTCQGLSPPSQRQTQRPPHHQRVLLVVLIMPPPSLHRGHYWASHPNSPFPACRAEPAHCQIQETRTTASNLPAPKSPHRGSLPPSGSLLTLVVPPTHTATSSQLIVCK